MKSKLFKTTICAAGLAAGLTLLRADPTLAPLFRDGAILQRDKPVLVWGNADPAEKVSVTFHQQTMTATADRDGRWRVTLKPEAASTTSSVLIVAGNSTVRIADVLVGDVWICSGQSNMEFAVRQALDAEHEIATADFPMIRQFKVPHLVVDQPADDCAGKWNRCSPAAVGEFTAVGFFFARDLFQRNGVPVGLVNSTWGGTQIEEWIGESVLRSDRSFAVVFERWHQLLAEYPEKVASHQAAVEKWKTEKEAAAASGKAFTRRQPATPEGLGSRWQPAGMYNGMIRPLEPYAVRGFLWYQGEENAARANEYGALFTALIKEWRADFGQGELPFYFVQLPGFLRNFDQTDSQWPLEREAQSRALALPATAMVVTLDVGDPANIHPKNKQEVGRRLALFARSELFGETVESHGPVYAGETIEGEAIRVRFSHAMGLNAGGQALDQFAVAGADQKFVSAVGRIEGESVVVSSPEVKAPIAVRYAWKNSPTACLFNGDHLPAAPFRSDDPGRNQ